MKNISLVVLVLCFGWTASLPAAEKMNVPFNAVNDTNCDLGVYENTQVKTPNLDR